MIASFDILLFAIPFAIAAGIPGPAQGALIAQVLARGGKSTMPFVLGMVAGNLMWLLAAIFGLSVLATRWEWLFWIVKWAGVIYLFFIAWQLWNTRTRSAVADRSTGRGVFAGALLTLGNPKAVIFFGAVLPHAFDMTSLSAGQILLIVLVGPAIDLTVQCAYLLTAAKARNIIRSERNMVLVNRASAGLIGGSAALIAARA